MLGPFATASCRYIASQSPGVASRTPAIAQAACDANDNAWQRGPLWPHGMGPINNHHHHHRQCL